MPRIEGLVGRTLRARPAGLGAAIGMATRAGFLRPIGTNLVLLPLGVRVMEAIESVICLGLECQVVRILGARVTDAAQVLPELMQGDIQSYRQLPLRIATIGETRAPMAGPSDETAGRPALTLHAAFTNDEALADFLAQAGSNLRRLAALAGLEAERVGGFGASEAIVMFGPTGQSIVLGCRACGSSHLREAAPFAREPMAAGAGAALERVHTPGASTIQALAEMLGVGRERTLKALFLATDADDLVFAVVRGDLDASLEKLAHVVGVQDLRAATDDEILACGAVPGFASPIGLHVRAGVERDGVRVVADRSVFTGDDFVAGANAPDFHYTHVDPRRDFSVTEVADLALAPAGARCAACGAALLERQGTIVARSSSFPGPQFTDESGREQRGAAGLVMVDLLALFEEIVGRNANDEGISWPAGLAPADVHVVSLKEDESAREIALRLEQEGLRALLDDRPVGAGAKFTDADLIGCPIRVTISPRSLQAGGAELAGRRGSDPAIVALPDLPSQARARLRALMST